MIKAKQVAENLLKAVKVAQKMVQVVSKSKVTTVQASTQVPQKKSSTLTLPLKKKPITDKKNSRVKKVGSKKGKKKGKLYF